MANSALWLQASFIYHNTIKISHSKCPNKVAQTSDQANWLGTMQNSSRLMNERTGQLNTNTSRISFCKIYVIKLLACCWLNTFSFWRSGIRVMKPKLTNIFFNASWLTYFISLYPFQIFMCIISFGWYWVWNLDRVRSLICLFLLKEMNTKASYGLSKFSMAENRQVSLTHVSRPIPLPTITHKCNCYVCCWTGRKWKQWNVCAHTSLDSVHFGLQCICRPLLGLRSLVFNWKTLASASAVPVRALPSGYRKSIWPCIRQCRWNLSLFS